MAQIQQDPSMAVQQTSPLLRLPAELRNRIYCYSLIAKAEIDVTELSKPNEPALLATSKQIRGESLGIYYRGNAFQFTTESSNSPFGYVHLRVCWLNKLGWSRASLIRALHINIRMSKAKDDIWAESFHSEQDANITLQVVRATWKQNALPVNVNRRKAAGADIAMLVVADLAVEAVKVTGPSRVVNRLDVLSIL